MAVPKKRTSKRRKGMRRSHHAIAFTASVTECPVCGSLKLSHHLCEDCGYYRGRKIIDVATDDGDDVSDSEDLSVED